MWPIARGDAYRVTRYVKSHRVDAASGGRNLEAKSTFLALLVFIVRGGARHARPSPTGALRAALTWRFRPRKALRASFF